MANWVTAIGNTSSDQAETCYLTGYNGNGDEIAFGTPVCWDEVAADGRTFKTAAATNIMSIAGVAEETVGTAQYTSRLVAYGPVEARTYGVATTFIPGANLEFTVGKTYLAYSSSMLVQTQPRVVSAWETNATVDTVRTTVFIHAL